MTTTKNKKIVLIAALVAVFIAGLVLGFLSGKSTDAYQKLFPQKELHEKDVYQSECTIYFAQETDSEKDYLSSTVTTLDPGLLQEATDLLVKCSDSINKDYPNVKYSLTLEPIENTQLCQIVAMCEDQKLVAEVCNKAAVLWIKEMEKTNVGISCEIIDFANIPRNPVGEDSVE